jgi:hypothetical protein
MNKNKRFKIGTSLIGFSAIVGSSIAIVACGSNNSVSDTDAIDALFVKAPI